MNGRTYLAMVSLVVLGAPATAQDRAAGASSRTEAQADAQVRTPQARIDAAMRAAAEAEISTALLESKVAEGEAKRIPRERIAAAVEARLAALRRAQAALKRARLAAASDAELSVTADALDAGVSESAVVRIHRSAPAERRVVAVAVLADLVRLGNESEPSLARVRAALGSSADLANLQADVSARLRLAGITSTLDATGRVRGR